MSGRVRSHSVSAVAVAVVLTLAGVAASSSAAPGQAPPAEPRVLDTAYDDQLRAVAGQVAASRREVAALPTRDQRNVADLLAAGRRLAASAAATRDVLRVYRDARTRYGTAEEWRLVKQSLADLDAARKTYEQRARVTVDRPTSKTRTQASVLFEEIVREGARRQIVRWTRDAGLADTLSAASLKELDDALVRAVRTRLRSGAEKAIANATGLHVALNVPLRQQVTAEANRLTARWLARVVFHAGPQSFVVQLAGQRIVSWVGRRLELAFRHSGNPLGRADRTMATFAGWRRQMLLAPPTWPLASARALEAKVRAELTRTGFLELDLRRGGHTQKLAELQRDKALTLLYLDKVLRARFLLDSTMQNRALVDLDALVGDAKRLLADVEQINRKLAALRGPTPPAATFAISGVSMPRTVKANAPGGDISVTWVGSPTFPVRMLIGPDSCPPGVNCTTPTTTFATKANPLVFKGAIWCTGSYPKPLVYRYSVWLVDAKGLTTAKKNADFTCTG